MNDLFPLIDRISDPKLKSKTVSCWDEAVRRGGWKKDDLHDIPFTLLATDIKFNLVQHTNGVAASAVALAEAMNKAYGGIIKIDSDVLVSGAILHDVGKLLEYARVDGKYVKSENGKLVRHPVSGAALAYELGLPQEVVHIIATHSFEGDRTPRSVESILVHHADFVNFEAVGGKG